MTAATLNTTALNLSTRAQAKAAPAEFSLWKMLSQVLEMAQVSGEFGSVSPATVKRVKALALAL